MEEIATSIGLNRRTLHRYFNGKSGLLDEIAQYACTICYQSTRNCIASHKQPEKQLKAMFYSDVNSGLKFQFLYSFYTSSDSMTETSKDYTEMMKLFRNVLNTLFSQGFFSPETTLKWAENFYFSTIQAAITSITIDNGTEATTIMDMAWSSFINGIVQDEIVNIN